MLRATVRCVLAVASIAVLATVAHAAGRATVRGAEAVNVRRAPDPDSAALATLPKGTVVKVERVVGGWALATLDNGQQGYIKAVFLALPAGIEVVALETASPGRTAPTTPSAPPTDTAVSPPGATPETRSEAGRRDDLERELGQLRDRLAALESAVALTPASATPVARSEGGEAAPSEGVLSGSAPTRVAGVLRPTPAQPPESQEIGPSLALAGVGVVVGFLLGAVYGQRQERKRRSRVRF
jgi:SH3 domain-containing protein